MSSTVRRASRNNVVFSRGIYLGSLLDILVQLETIAFQQVQFKVARYTNIDLSL